MQENQKKSIFTTQEIAYLALVTAACVVGRLLFQFVPNIQPMTAIFILITTYLGISRGLVVNILSVLITNIYLGMGIWTIGQITGFSIIILLVGVLNKWSVFHHHLFLQVGYSFLAGFIYGLVLAVIDTKIYGLSNFWAYYLGGISFDFLHAVGNSGFYLVLTPVFKRLFEKQVKRKQEL